MDCIVDLIIYAHDGRGLGHVSRSVAIGLAVRRMFPDMSVLLVTGCGVTQELIAGGPLDWLKLPSYKTKISGGKSSGVEGLSGINDKLLGELRGRSLEQIFETYRPKVFLADHTPQGKHKELIPSHSVSPETVRVLGIRAVVGDVDKVWSDFSADVFRNAYSKILWYGDSSVAGGSEIERIRDCYAEEPFEAGYVSRLAELSKLRTAHGSAERLAGVISVPWAGAGTYSLLSMLAEALGGIPDSLGRWKIYLNLNESGLAEVVELFSAHGNVDFAQVGPQFLEDLMRADSAVIYGGYNSLTDVMAAGVPSTVFLRGMKDGEQEEHAAILRQKSSSIVSVLPEEGVTVQGLKSALMRNFEKQPESEVVNMNGAENAAVFLAGLAGVVNADS